MANENITSISARDLTNTQDQQEQIRIRAYYFSMNRTDHPGDAVQDWLDAERERFADGSATESVRR